MSVLLVIDIGVKTGLALYGHDGRLLWYRSQNFGPAQRLRRGALDVGWLADLPEVIRRSSPSLTRPRHVQDR